MRPTVSVVLVTGASYGLGPVIAKQLAAGLRLRHATQLHFVLVARTESGLAATAADITALGASAEVLVADVGSAGDRDRVVDHLISTWGRLDVLVSNAALSPIRLCENSPWPEIEQVLLVNAVAPLALARALLPMMRMQDSGAIVMVSSLAGKFGLPYNAAYSASKGALIQWVRAMQSELRGTGVRVASVCPTSAVGVGVRCRQ